ncbi:MAG: dTMP kinase [Deltaproteobacteria bacterium]|nr:dTMP kinase [Deltaproteobacteria bacterium]
MPQSGGRLIAFEGIDGTGKSTQITLLAGVLRQQGYEVVVTCEPTNGGYGQKIRALYKSRDSVSPAAELELFLADRREHIGKLIAPSLTAGKIILTDRYYLSTIAYQGAAGLDPAIIMQKNAFAPPPDLAVIIDLSPEQAVKRIQQGRGEALNSFEHEDYLAKVAEVFRSMKMPYIRWVDGTLAVHDVQRQIMAEVQNILPGIPA